MNQDSCAYPDMQQLHDLMECILETGERRVDRTGTGTLSIFGWSLRFDLAKGFPAVTTKKLHFKSVVGEMLWMLRGETNVKWLREQGVTIWDEWADKDGEVGRIYGVQWRQWRSPNGQFKAFDQIQCAINTIRSSPASRRILVSAWNVGELNEMSLPPCPVMFQFYVHNDGRLSCQVYQRSADVFLGLPFDIAGYALLTHLVAKVTGLKPGELSFCLGDAHLYLNHIDQARLMLTREHMLAPSLVLTPDAVAEIDDFKPEHIILENYEHHPHIKAEVSI